MDNKMTEEKWVQFVDSLKFRKAQLEDDLRNEDYSSVKGVAHSKRRQLEAIDLLLSQVPYKYYSGE